MPVDRPTQPKSQRTKVAEFGTKTTPDAKTKTTVVSGTYKLVCRLVLGNIDAEFRLVGEFGGRAAIAVVGMICFLLLLRTLVLSRNIN